LQNTKRNFKDNMSENFSHKKTLLVFVIIIAIVAPTSASEGPYTCADFPTLASCQYVAIAPYVHEGPPSAEAMDTFCAATGHTAAYTCYGYGYAAPGDIFTWNLSHTGWDLVAGWNSGCSWDPVDSWNNQTIAATYRAFSPDRTTDTSMSMDNIICSDLVHVPYSMIIVNSSQFNLQANFTATPLSGPASLPVQFNDNSTGSPTSWSWDFGDGGTSIEQNATHTYTAAGTYDVSLTAANAGGSDTEEKVRYITVTPPAIPSSKIGVFRNGFWILDGNGNFSWDGTRSGKDIVAGFGTTGDVPVVGNWNHATSGDKIGVFRSGTWLLDYNGNFAWDGSDKTVSIGQAGDVPVIGDWNSNGDKKIGVFRSGTWILDGNRTTSGTVPGQERILLPGSVRPGTFRW
jgi:PKD repeat protein